MSQNIADGETLVLEVHIWSASHVQLSVLRRYYRVTTLLGGPITFLNVATAYSNLVEASYKDLIYNGATFRGVRVRRVAPANDDNWAIFTGDAGVGISGPNALPLQTSGLITFGGPTMGARGLGRQYIPFPAVLDNTAAGEPTVGYKNRVAVLGGLIVADLSVASGGSSVVLSHVNWRSGSLAFQYLDIVQRVGNWATQRKRGSYGKANQPAF